MLICMTDLMQILSQIEQGDAGQPPKYLICDRDSIFDCSAFGLRADASPCLSATATPSANFDSSLQMKKSTQTGEVFC